MIKLLLDGLYHLGSPRGINPSSEPTSGAPNPTMHQRSAEANSGAAFLRRVGSSIDPTFTPRSKVLDWNVGLRPFPLSIPPLREPIPISDVISQSEMSFLAAVYFEKVNPYYCILDQNGLPRKINQKWLQSSMELFQTADPCEALLAPIAGSLLRGAT